jgi:pyruvate dehydrogenase E1 component alpha subunit
VAIREALVRARAGEGPSLIEAVTYRLMMHTTADDPKKYRTEDEEKCAWAREPLLRTRQYLQAKGYWDDAREEALLAEVKAQVEAAVQEFESPKDWAQDDPFRHVYGTEHAGLKAQHQDFLANVELEADHG